MSCPYKASYKGNITEHCFNNKQTPFLTLVATATGKYSRALKEQIVLINKYNLHFI
jgi:hypothetical protein